MEINSTIKKAIATYGKDIQLTVAVEELSELIKEICKHKRGNDNLAGITEEMGDCYIILAELQHIFGIDDKSLTTVIKAKLARLENRLRGLGNEQ